MASRAYRRNNKGQFAGSGGGTKVTYGKAGGFANAAFRSRVQAQRASSSKSLGGAAGARPKKSTTRRLSNKKLASAAAQVAVGGAVYAVGARSLTRSPSVRNVLIANSGLVLAAHGVASATGKSKSRPKVLTGKRLR